MDRSLRRSRPLLAVLVALAALAAFLVFVLAPRRGRREASPPSHGTPASAAQPIERSGRAGVLPPAAPLAPAAAETPVPSPAAVAPPPAPSGLPPAPSGLSWEDASSVERTFERIERRLRTGRPPAEGPVIVTERQLNSYVNLTLRSRIPPGVSGIELRLLQDGVAARALVDLDRLRERLSQGSASRLLSLVSGTVPVELAGKLRAADGVGRIELEQASVGGVSLPAAIVAQMVAASTRTASRPRGFDILSPFVLPSRARELRLEPGRAIVTFYRDRP